MKRRRCRHEDGLRPNKAKSPLFLPFSHFHFFISEAASFKKALLSVDKRDFFIVKDYPNGTD